MGADSAELVIPDANQALGRVFTCKDLTLRNFDGMFENKAFALPLFYLNCRDLIARRPLIVCYDDLCNLYQV